MTNVPSGQRHVERPAILTTPSRALTIGAHPDDAEFGAGGTLARWGKGGCETSMLIVTDGSKGTWDTELSADRLVEMRRAEQRRAADALGAGEVIMLDHVDGELEYSMALREELCGWIRRLRPEVVLTHDPWHRYMLHPDHRVTGMAAVDGVVAARDHLFFPHQLVEGITKHRPDAILLWSADEPDYYEDISSTFDAKLAALLCHSSQARNTLADAMSGEEQMEQFVKGISEWSAQQGEPVGLPLAESFRLLRP